MMIETVLHRVRIGLFNNYCRQRSKPPKCGRYDPYSPGSDIHLRTCISGAYLLFIFLCFYGVVFGQKHIEENYSTADDYVMYDFCGQTVLFGTTPGLCNQGIQYSRFSQRLLMLSADIEQNPGPTAGPTADTRIILDAITESNNKMFAEIGTVKHEVLNIKSEIHCLKDDLNSVKQSVKSVTTKQADIEGRLRLIEETVDHIKFENSTIQSDLENFSFWRDTEYDRLQVIEDQINRIETDKVRSNLRVFGLPEIESSDKPLESLIHEFIFSVTGKDDRIGVDSVDKAQRVGTSQQGKPRMVLLKFKDSATKFKLFKYRDRLRANGLRISNDLTFLQREQIKVANEKGLFAYFKNGILHTEPRRNSRDQRPREVKRAKRTLDDRNRELLRSVADNTQTGGDVDNYDTGTDAAEHLNMD